MIKCKDNENVIVIPMSNILEFRHTKLAQKIWKYAFIDQPHTEYFSKSKDIACGYDKQLIFYQENEIKYDLFRSVFYKIYNHLYINLDIFKQYKREILLYGFQYNNLLISEEPLNEEMKECKMDNKIDLDSKEIILCNNTSQQSFILNTIKQKRLQYIPFKLMLLEGIEDSNR